MHWEPSPNSGAWLSNVGNHDPAKSLCQHLNSTRHFYSSNSKGKDEEESQRGSWGDGDNQQWGAGFPDPRENLKGDIHLQPWGLGGGGSVWSGIQIWASTWATVILSSSREDASCFLPSLLRCENRGPSSVGPAQAPFVKVFKFLSLLSTAPVLMHSFLPHLL